jgi:membrane protein
LSKEARGTVWLVGSLALSWYVSTFGSYNATYGSLGAVIGFLVWLWFPTSNIIVLVGAEIAAEMEHHAARDTTGEAEKPRGHRAASATKLVKGNMKIER